MGSKEVVSGQPGVGRKTKINPGARNC